MFLPSRLLYSCGAAAIALALAAPAQAQARLPLAPPPPDATVVAIDSGELVVDIGSTKGVHDGDVLELWRPVRLRHPVTGQVLVDRFRIGSLRLTQVRSTLSLSVVEGALSRPPATGDVVVLPERGLDASASAAAAKPTPPLAARASAPGTGTATATAATTVTAPVATAAPADGDALALGEMMTALTGSDPAHRALAYETFTRAHPRSRFARVLREEVEALRAPARTEHTYQSSAPKLDRVRAGEPQSFAVELDPAFVGAVVHVRHKGAAGYRSLPMENVGPRYWAATLPGDAITDGGMEYFVEGVPKESAVVAVIGTAATPRDVAVEALPGSPRPPGTLAQVALQSEYASFNAKRANDYVWQTEGSVGWRLHDQGIRAIRSGFGVLRGEGGPLKDLDELGKAPKTVGLTYGYVEAEIALSHAYALIARPILGLRERGITGGAQAFVRVGNDLQTNLSIGGEVLGSVGQRGIVQLDWRTIRRVPIVLRTEVTNQPANSSDVGARAIAQVGYQLTNELVVAVRGSYQGRTINHAGPGAGLAVSYQW
ncbi:MAG: hypothetical protein QOI41_7145 [Myxococcales bacterium]|nr:hypothetical protein [Myxococcales bacterium]